MKIMFYKARAAIVLYIKLILSKVLFVDSTPVFASAAVIEKNGKLLFIDHSYAKGIGLPGGVVKENENLEEALKREVFEETGLKVKNEKYFGSFSTYLKKVPTSTAVFIVETDGEVRDSDEGKLVWLEPEEAIGKLTYKDNELAIKKYIQYSSKN